MGIDIRNVQQEASDKYDLGGGGWLSLEEGDNKVRILQTRLADFGSHYVQSESKSYTCIGKDEGCPFCEKEKPRVRYLTWVIDKRDGEFKKFEFGHSIAKQLETLANDEEYGIDETGFPYWINVKRSGTGLETEYNLVPGRKEVPLTQEQKKDFEELDSLHDFIEQRKQNTINEFGVDSSPAQKRERPPVDSYDEDIPVVEDDDEPTRDDLEDPYDM